MFIPERHPSLEDNLVQLHMIVEKPHEEYLKSLMGGIRVCIKWSNARTNQYISKEIVHWQELITYIIPIKILLSIGDSFKQAVLGLN